MRKKGSTGNQMRDALKAAGVQVAKQPPAEHQPPEHSPKPASVAKSVSFQAKSSMPPLMRPLQVLAARAAPSMANQPTPKPKRPDPVVAPSAPPMPVQLLATGHFTPHALFIDDSADDPNLASLNNSGVTASLSTEPENASDMILGLDFGTSSTKAVIRDAYAANSTFPVKLNGNAGGVNSYLLPSTVFRTGDVYSLMGGTHRLDNLKLALLECKARSPITEFNDCCAYLALVVRRSRAWLFDEHRDIYGLHDLSWKLNLGIPARSYESPLIVELFRRLAWAAANLASDATAPEITREAANEWRLRSIPIASSGCLEGSTTPFSWHDVDVVPEISAQIHGFMTSTRWDWASRPIMMLVDVGAGTVDSAIFHVRVPEKKSGILTFYSSRVEQLGAMNLHRTRVHWLKSMVPTGTDHDPLRSYLNKIAESTGRLRPIPERVQDYVPGYSIPAPAGDIDLGFKEDRYRRQVAGCILEAKVAKGIKPHQLHSVPLLLSGGGSRMMFYQGIQDSINSTPNWSVGVELMKMPVPSELVEVGWTADEFDRISVAYGLSLGGLGSIVRSIDVPDVRLYTPQGSDEKYISKDQV